MVFMSIRVYDHNVLIREAYVEATISKEKLDQEAKESQRIKQQSAGAMAAVSTSGSPAATASTGSGDSDLAAATKRTTRMQELAQEAQELTLNTIRKKAELDSDEMIMKANFRDLTVLMISSGVLSLLGFWFWYHRLQRPQDRLLEAQVELRLRRLKEGTSRQASST